MGLLLDFVPNHMGVGSDNPWWLDVLEWGPLSPYADLLRHRLGGERARRARQGDPAGARRSVRQGARGGRAQAAVRCRRGHVSHRLLRPSAFPIAVRRYPQLLHSTANLLDRGGGAAVRARGPVRGAVRRRRRVPRSGPCAGRRRSRSRRRWPRPRAIPRVRAALDAAVAAQNGTPGLPDSFEALHELLEDQAYRLAYWRVASSEINYRRFFDINQLAGLRMEQGEVFEATHRLLLRLIAEGKVHGVRLDHIDGLYDPRGYCQRLLSRVADVLADEPRTANGPRSTRASGRPIYLRGREDPGASRVAARGSAGRRHHRLRVHQPRQRPVRRSRGRRAR